MWYLGLVIIRSRHDPAQNLTLVGRVVDTTITITITSVASTDIPALSAEVLAWLEVLCSDEERGEEETKCEAYTWTVSS